MPDTGPPPSSKAALPVAPSVEQASRAGRASRFEPPWHLVIRSAARNAGPLLPDSPAADIGGCEVTKAGLGRRLKRSSRSTAARHSHVSACSPVYGDAVPFRRRWATRWLRRCEARGVVESTRRSPRDSAQSRLRLTRYVLLSKYSSKITRQAVWWPTSRASLATRRARDELATTLTRLPSALRLYSIDMTE